MSLVSAVVMICRLVWDGPAAAPPCVDRVESRNLEDPIKVECSAGAAVDWKLEAVKDDRWLIVRCRCSAPEPPDASADAPEASDASGTE